MTHCPKCGGDEIAGPFYRPPSPSSLHHRFQVPEKLIYRCQRCGYAEAYPTFDKRKTQIP